MSDCLELEDRNYCFWIRWIIDGDTGATLGEDVYTEAQLAKASPEDRSHLLATVTASKTDGVMRDESNGYYWDNRKQATAALRAIRAALKNDTGAPWPEWTVKALAAGWKAPKGWKP